MARKPTYEELERRVKELEEKQGRCKRAEEALLESERKTRAILDQTFQFIGLMEPDGTLIDANRSALKFGGIDESDVLGKPFWETPWWTHSQEQQEKLRDGISKAATGEFIRFEANHPGPDGSTHYVDCSLKPVKDETGNVVFIIPEGRDVTERKRAEDELRESEERYRNILKNIEDAYYEIDLAGNFTFFNDSLCRLLGYSKEELMGMNYRQGMAEKDSKDAFKAFNKVYTTGKAANRYEMELIRKDRSKRYTEASISLIKGSEGKPLGFRGIVRDITRRKKAEDALRKARAELERRVEKRTAELVTANKKLKREIKERNRSEEALRESEKRYRLLAENVSDIIWTIDMNMRFTYVSPSVKRQRDYSAEEAMSLSVEETLTPSSCELVMDIFSQELALEDSREEHDTARTRTFEVEQLCKDGSTVWGEVTASFLRDKDGKPVGVLGVTRDISERKKADVALREAKVAAEIANIAKSNFLANMSHEIRTPMNGITGFADMLLDTDLDKDQVEYVKTIKRSGDALLSLINDILDLSKIEAGELDIEETEFDPELLAYDVCELIRPKIESKPVEILCRIGDRLPSRIKGDPLRFRQVLTNLMGNASKFTEVGEIELSLDIEEEKDDRVKLHATIRDTGIGISKEKLNTIFDPFQQADNSTTRRFGGTGLGLAICRQIANIMDGTVWVESEVDKGSIFHFTAWVGKAEGEAARRSSSIGLSGKKVLIVDDNQTNLKILTHILESVSTHVVSLSKSEEVIATLQNDLESNSPFDICISDIQMPVMSGHILAKQIRDPKHRFSDIPMIALSSSTKGDAKKCEEAGFDGFLSKPLQREKLFQMLERILGEKEEKDEEVSPKIMTQYSVREDMKHSVCILLVEDNPVNQKLAKMILTKAGYQVEVANDGQEAVEKYTASPDDFDLIFMDVQMPEMDGIEATKAIREEGFDSIPIVAMTAHAMKGDREECLAVGMDDYIPKPIKREVVFEVLRKWVFDKKVS
jgi:PAS domain S-box-containing protein